MSSNRLVVTPLIFSVCSRDVTVSQWVTVKLAVAIIVSNCNYYCLSLKYCSEELAACDILVICSVQNKNLLKWFTVACQDILSIFTTWELHRDDTDNHGNFLSTLMRAVSHSWSGCPFRSCERDTSVYIHTNSSFYWHILCFCQGLCQRYFCRVSTICTKIVRVFTDVCNIYMNSELLSSNIHTWIIVVQLKLVDFVGIGIVGIGRCATWPSSLSLHSHEALILNELGMRTNPSTCKYPPG